MHCEATSEKYAMGWFLDGRVSAVVGSHTHVQTADERILDDGTAYITDIGMTGSYGALSEWKKKMSSSVLRHFPRKRAEHSKDDVWICAVVIDVDEETGQARNIERLRIEYFKTESRIFHSKLICSKTNLPISSKICDY